MRNIVFQRSNNWSVPQEGHATTALFTPDGIFIENGLPQEEQSLRKVCCTGSEGVGVGAGVGAGVGGGLFLVGKAIPPLFT